MKIFRTILTFLLALFVLAFPLANQDLFAVYHSKLFPARIILLVIIAFSGLFFILAGDRRKRAEKGILFLRTDRPAQILLGLWLVRVVSLVNTLNLGASLNLLAFYTAMVALYFILRFLASCDSGGLRKLYSLHVVVAVLVAFYALVQLLMTFRGIRLPGVLVGGNYVRVPGTFYDANHLPAYLVTVIPFLLGLSWIARRKYQNLAAFVLAVTLSGVVLSTFSRSGMLAAGVGFLVMIVGAYLFGWWRKVLGFTVLVLLAIVVLALTSQTEYSLLKRIGSVVDPAEKSTTAHKILLAGEWGLFLKNPVIGVGYGGFSEHFRASWWGQEHARIDTATHVRLPPHSLWLETLVETGILGFAFYLSFIALVIRSLIRAIFSTFEKPQQVFLLSLLASVIGVMSGALFYSYNLEFLWFLLFFSLIYSQRFFIKSPAVAVVEEEVDWRDVLLPAFLGVVGLWLIFWRLGATELIDWDEAIYAGVAKNMWLRKDFFSPFWNGHNWWEKPPLYMWLTVPVLYFYQVTSFAARFWPALLAWVGVIATYFLGRALFASRLAGYLSALVLLTNVAYLQYGRMAMLDVPLTTFCTLALLCYVLGSQKLRWWYFLLAGANCGLAVMTKGVIGLIPLVVIGGWIVGKHSLAFLERSKGSNCREHRRRMVSFGFWLLVGFLAVAAPWHIYMSAKFGRSFTDQYIFYHVLKRGAEAIEGKAAGRWVYITVIRHSLRIWYPVLLLSLPWVGWRLWRKDRRLLLPVVWAVVVFGLFTAAQSKLMWYIVPIYPALSLIVGGFLAIIVRKINVGVRPLRWRYNRVLGVEPLMVVAITVLSLIYVGMKWKMVEPQDDNRDKVYLIRRKENLPGRAAHDPLIITGFASPVPLYYGSGPVVEIPKEALESYLQSPQRLFALMDYPEYSRLKEKVGLRLAAASTSEGDLVLVEKPAAGK